MKGWERTFKIPIICPNAILWRWLSIDNPFSWLHDYSEVSFIWGTTTKDLPLKWRGGMGEEYRIARSRDVQCAFNGLEGTPPPASGLRVQPHVTSSSHSRCGDVDARRVVSAHVRFELINRERARARARVLCVAVSRSAKRLTMADEKPKVSATKQSFRCLILLRARLVLRFCINVPLPASTDKKLRHTYVFL